MQHKKRLVLGNLGKAVICRSCQLSSKPEGAQVQPVDHRLNVAVAALRNARSLLLPQ